MGRRILYISTNHQWSGSEELWSRSALLFSSTGYKISFFTHYNHATIDKVGMRRISLIGRSIFEKILLKFKNANSSFRHRLRFYLLNERPDLVVISQGNNLQALEIIECCLESSIPYITITQLVAEVQYLKINSTNLQRIQNAYIHSLKNYFVSQHNLHLNNRMLGITLSNAEVIFNPCKVKTSMCLDYPQSNILSIGMVGRVECYHKGYDLLIQIMENKKWKDRPVEVNIYGNGPHRDLLSIIIKSKGIRNISFMDYKEDIQEIWKENHILLMASRMEGQALSLIEAMWCGRAAIVTDTGGARELIEENVCGFIAESATSEAVDRALERAWEKRHQWKEMGEAAALKIRRIYPDDEVQYFNNKILQLFSSV